MALIKCSECLGDVSDKALVCPHCGNPMNINSNAIIDVPATYVIETISESKQSKSKIIPTILSTIAFLALFLSLAVFITHFVFPESKLNKDIEILLRGILSEQSSSGNHFSFGNFSFQDTAKAPIPEQKTNSAPVNPLAVKESSSGKIYPFEQINLWGYSFYTSKIDGSDNVDIGSQNKQLIGKLFLKLEFPHGLTTKLAIISADPTLMRSNDKYQIPWAGTLQVPLAIQPEGGLYTQVGGGALILLNGGYDLGTLTHELGHQIGFNMTDQEWAQYYKLRSIPVSTPRHGSDWFLSPEEDFAEAYRSLYGEGSSSIQTHYGILTLRSEFSIGDPCYSIENDLTQNYARSKLKPNDYMISSALMTEAKNAVQANSKLQSCRWAHVGEVDMFGRPLYANYVGPLTAKFIKSVVARLSS